MDSYLGGIAFGLSVKAEVDAGIITLARLVTLNRLSL